MGSKIEVLNGVSSFKTRIKVVKNRFKVIHRTAVKVRPRARTFCYESEQNNRRESKEFGTKKARKTKMS